jgi:cytochrome c-type biogenesis protein CcmH/NrfG
MNPTKYILTVLALMLIFSLDTTAQVDELSDATGLPIPIGASAIYGQVTLSGISRSERKPVIFVHLFDRGIPVERREVNQSGYYYFLRTPRDGYVLTFEIDGKEVGRMPISGSMGARFRQDVMLDWTAINGATRSATGTVSASSLYSRSAEADKAFEKAMEAYKAKKNEDSISRFKAVVQQDPKDFVAWTVLGSVYFDDGKFPEASQAFNKALEQNPKFNPAFINLGRAEIAQKNFDKAVDVLSKAVENDPQSADANHMLGEAYLQAKKGSLAVGYLNKAIELAPVEKAEIHLRLAALYNAAGLKDRAAAEYKAFLSKVKDHPDKKKFEEYIKNNSAKQ